MIFKHVNLIWCLTLMIVVTSSCGKKDMVTIDPIDKIINNIPFPNHTSYVGSHIKPTNYSQVQLDGHAQSLFDDWKNAYLKNNCNSAEYYIKYRNDAHTVSEAHGYGMMIMCLMAGYEESAKKYFDGMYSYYKSHPSNINAHLMDWQQITCSDSPSVSDGSASDGDIDIAYSLILAHSQWGSDGDINYQQAAINIIQAIMQDEINQETWTVKLGDWSDSSNANYYYGTRTSDFITSHFKAFGDISNNANWTSVVNTCYNIIDATHNTSTGLVPDFVINSNTFPIPANSDFLEGPYDGNYYYNDCRFPSRIGTDYLVYGDNRAKSIVDKMSSWLKTSTGGNVSSLSNGYILTGTPIFDWNDATFIAPMAVGAMANAENQEWLNSLYRELITQSDFNDGDYYSNTIKLLSMITISGNYWTP